MPKQYRSVSMSQDNYEWLKAISAVLTDNTGMVHSINDVVTKLRKKTENDQEFAPQATKPTTAKALQP